MMRGSANVLDGRVQEVSDISRGPKAMAKALDVPVLALSQLGSPEHIAAMGLAEVDVAKQRHGLIGTIPMRFNGAYTKFSDMGVADA